jgi:hypothetical protein
VLRRLGRRTYGRRRRRAGGPPRARRAYGGAVRGVLGRGERREVWASGGAQPRAEEASGRRAGHGHRGSAGAGRRRTAHGHAMSRCAGAQPGTVLLSLSLKLNYSKNLNTTRPNFEYESYRSSYPLSFSKRLYGVFLHRFCNK